jgi:hypothetical protein
VVGKKIKMTSNQFFNKLLRELSYRSTEGYPILAKKEHQDLISDILSEWGMGSMKSELIQNLTEGGDEDAQYKHLGQGFYVKAGDAGKEGAQKFTKDDNGKYSPVSDDEYEKQKNKAGEEGGPTNNPNAEPKEKGGEEGQAVGGEQPPAEPEKGTSLQDTESQERFKKEQEAADKSREETPKDETSDDTKLSNSTNEELAGVDSTKVKKQILMTVAETEQSQEGVGLGTAESRTGECVTVYAGQKIQELMNEGKSYDEARDEVEIELLTIAKDSNNVLTKEWVKSGLAVFDYLSDELGIENIEHFAWDTPEGNQLVQSTGHGTSADMFLRTKDGKTIGVSLKKDFKVFIVNGGYGKAMKEFETKMGITLPEHCQASNYTKRRGEEFNKVTTTIESDPVFFEEQAKNLLEDEKLFNKTFGPKKDAIRKRKKYAVQQAFGLTSKEVSELSDDEIKQKFSEITPSQLVDIIKNPKNGDDMKFAAAFLKQKPIQEKYGLYSNLRNLDNEMTDNIFEFFQGSEESREKYKEKIIEDTHIIDTLFPNKPLSDFKTLFGTNPAVEMTREAIGNIFGISSMMEEYENATTDEEKLAIRKKIEKTIKDKLVISKKKGTPVIAIILDGPPASELPLYKLGVRTRGIGNAQTLEVSQEVFGSLALKNGNTDIMSWDIKDRNTVIYSEVKDIESIIDDEEFNIEDLSLEELQDLKDRLSQLSKWNPASPSLKKLLTKFPKGFLD